MAILETNETAAPRASLPRRVVIAEDAEELRDLMTILLERAGYDVEACEDADEAFAAVQRERPDLVLTDLMMGRSNGLDLITRIRSDLAPPIPPVVVCSGFPAFESEALQRGAAAFLPKPFEREGLVRTLNSILDKRVLAEGERRKAVEHSQSLRRSAIDAACRAAARLAPRREDLARRASWSTELMPRYFGFGEAFIALIAGDHLESRATSSSRRWSSGTAVELSLCRDILETSSALVTSDLHALGAEASAPDGAPLRFFAGVPLLSDGVAVGVFCFVDVEPHRFGSDGFIVLEALGRRASDSMSLHSSDALPAWTERGHLTREALHMLLGAELTRMEREDLALSVFAFSSSAPALDIHERSATAEIGKDRYAALFVRPTPDACLAAVVEFARTGRAAEHLGAGGVLSFERGPLTLLDARGIVSAAESLLEMAEQAGAGRIERTVVRRETLALDLVRPGNGAR